MTDNRWNPRCIVVLANRTGEGSATCATIDCALNLLSLEGHNRFSSIQDRGYAIICKNIRRYLSKNVIGGEVSKNTAWKIG